MKLVSYILLGVALLLAIIGLVLLIKQNQEKRDAVLTALEKARDVKATKKAEKEKDIIEDLEKEINDYENLKNTDHASTKKETE